MKWKQRAQVNWLKPGDHNTRYFHACANTRRARNLIAQIRNRAGNLCSSQTDIEQAFTSFFQELFTANPIHDHIETCTQSIRHKVTTVMNQQLLAPFTMEDISVALNQMAPTKTPSLDGFSVDLFQQNWETVYVEVCEAILHLFNTSKLDVAINTTNIALVPKISNPECVIDYHPISLCNVLYKLVSKVLANRLKKFLPQIISPYQSTFITGKLIINNVLAAYETLYTMLTCVVR